MFPTPEKHARACQPTSPRMNVKHGESKRVLFVYVAVLIFVYARHRQDLFCSTNGFTGEGTWTNCLSTLNDPCSCKFPDQNGRLRGVTCHHNVNNGTAHIDQIDFSGGYHGMREKLPNFVLRMHKLSLLDLKGNLIEGELDFNAHTNLW